MRDLIKVFSAILSSKDDKAKVKQRAAEGLQAKLKKEIVAAFENPYSKKRWNQKLYFEKEAARVKSLSLQTQGLMSAFTTSMNIYIAGSVEEC